MNDFEKQELETKKQIVTLTTDLKTATAQAAEQKTLLTELQGNLTTLEGQKASVNDELIAAKNAVKTEAAKVSEAKNSLAASLQENELLTNQITTLKQSDNTNSNENLGTEKPKAEAPQPETADNSLLISQLEAEKISLASKIAEIETAKDLADDGLTAAQADLEKLQEVNEKLTTEKDNALAKALNAKNKLEAAEAASKQLAAKLETEKGNVAQANKEARKTLAEQQQKHEKALTEINATKTKLEGKKNTLQAALTEANNTNTQNKTAADQVSNDLTQALKREEKINKKIQQLKSAANKNNPRLDKLEAEKATNEQTILDLTTANQKAVTDLENSQAQLIALQETSEITNTTLEQLQGQEKSVQNILTQFDDIEGIDLNVDEDMTTSMNNLLIQVKELQEKVEEVKANVEEAPTDLPVTNKKGIKVRTKKGSDKRFIHSKPKTDYDVRLLEVQHQGETMDCMIHCIINTLKLFRLNITSIEDIKKAYESVRKNYGITTEFDKAPDTANFIAIIKKYYTNLKITSKMGTDYTPSQIKNLLKETKDKDMTIMITSDYHAKLIIYNLSDNSYYLLDSLVEPGKKQMSQSAAESYILKNKETITTIERPQK